jgi:hypothetical protein
VTLEEALDAAQYAFINSEDSNNPRAEATLARWKPFILLAHNVLKDSIERHPNDAPYSEPSQELRDAYRAAVSQESK